MIEVFKPMLAVNVPVFLGGGDYLYEFKWDGIRLMFDNRLDSPLYSRSLTDKTKQFPELLPELNRVERGTVLDGEVIALAGGKQSFYAVLSRSASNGAKTNAQIYYMVFDILLYKGENVCGLPLSERKRLLTDAVSDGERVRKTTIHSDGNALLSAADAEGLEGIMAKNRNMPYLPAMRSSGYIKVKLKRRIIAHVVGYYLKTELVLCLAHYENGGYTYIGNASTGLSESQRFTLFNRLSLLACTEGVIPSLKATMVKPVIMVEVEFLERSKDGKLRHPVILRVLSENI